MWKSAVCAWVCVSDMPPSPHPPDTYIYTPTLQPYERSMWYTASAPPCTTFNAHPGPSDHNHMQIHLHMQYLPPGPVTHQGPCPPPNLSSGPVLFYHLHSWKSRCWVSCLCGGCAASRTLWSWIVGWVSVTGWLSVRCWPSPAQLRLLQIRRWGGLSESNYDPY